MSILVIDERVSYYPLTKKGVRLAIYNSVINGKGLFSLQNVMPGQVAYETRDYLVGTAPFYGSVQRSPFVHILEKHLRWVNHSCTPNCRLILDESAVKLIATKTIYPGMELLCNYDDTETSIPAPFVCNCGYCNDRLIS